MNQQNSSSSQPNQKIKKTKKIPVIIVCAIILVIAITAVSVFVLIQKGRSNMLIDKNPVSINTDSTELEVDYDDETIEYKGKKYIPNENMTSVLCIGIDRENFSTNGTYGTSGQADAIFLMALDTATGKTTLIAIPRDSMVDVDLYSVSGSYISSEREQICLAYAYGDGKEKSCENVAKSVSRLLYGIPVKSYIAINTNAISTVCRKIGGVPVTLDADFKLMNGTVVRAGKEFIVNGSNAADFIRARENEPVDASYVRMNRQVVFLKSLSAKAISKVKEDITFPLTMFSAISKDCVTDIGASNITFLTSCFLSGKFNTNVEFKSLIGETAVGPDQKAEFYPDEESTFECILNTFYNVKE